MKDIKWGIIGCGDVTEIKSGPAFNNVENSSLVAVMRRDAAKAKDYARRHQVASWYNLADDLINDDNVNAIYIATPPLQHEAYCLSAIKSGKPVYVEKPMAIDYKAAQNMAEAAENAGVKLTVAHYRRQWPLFQKLKELVDCKSIGDIYLVNLTLHKPEQTNTELAEPKTAWRVDAAISGGGLFHDLAPHQLDILYWIFGNAKKIQGVSASNDSRYPVDDLVCGHILFENNTIFTGTWCFTAAENIDSCEFIGTEGKIRFSFFNNFSIEIISRNENNTYEFQPLAHVQQPMIAATVKYLRGEGSNPCTGKEGAEIMRWIEQITAK